MLGKLLILVILVAGVSGGIYYASLRGYINRDLAQKVDFQQLQQLQSLKLPASSGDQTNTLVQRGSEVVSHTQQVLGTQITASEDKQPISQRAFEYGRYLYCQQVVKDYENTH